MPATLLLVHRFESLTTSLNYLHIFLNFLTSLDKSGRCERDSELTVLVVVKAALAFIESPSCCRAANADWPKKQVTCFYYYC